MSTHRAVVTVALRAKLEILEVTTVKPASDEVRVRNEWTTSGPLEVHQNDGGLLVKHPQILGDSIAGTVVETGVDVTSVKVGDKVMGFAWREEKEKGYQEYVVVPEYLLGKVPDGISLPKAVTVPTNFVTVFRTLTADLGFRVDWPLDANASAPEHADAPIVVWGASSSVGQYAVQILKYLGYRQVYGIASSQHHARLKQYGAEACFDYRDDDIVGKILQQASASGYTKSTARIPFVIDCIGSKNGSLEPITKLVEAGSTVAAMLPVILRAATETSAPEYSLDLTGSAAWPDGVTCRGVRAHFYLENELFKAKLQSQIMPRLLADGVVKPNKIRLVEGDTLLERAQKAVDMLRRKEVSGEKLVWRVAEEEVGTSQRV